MTKLHSGHLKQSRAEAPRRNLPVARVMHRNKNRCCVQVLSSRANAKGQQRRNPAHAVRTRHANTSRLEPELSPTCPSNQAWTRGLAKGNVVNRLKAPMPQP